MRLVLFFILFLICHQNIFGQEDTLAYKEINKLLDEDKFDLAQTLIDSFAAKYPNDLNYEIYKSKLLYFKGSKKEAFEYTKTLINKYPSFPFFLTTYGQLYEFEKDYACAEDLYKKAFDLCKTDSCRTDVRLIQAFLKTKENKYLEAIEILKLNLEVFPNDYLSIGRLGYLYFVIGNEKESLKYSKKAAKYKFDEQIMNNIALVYSSQNKYKKSIVIYEQLLQINPKNPRTLNNLGYAYVQAGKEALGLLYIHKSLSIWPDNSYAYRNLALTHIKMKDFDTACEFLKKALELNFTKYYGNELLEMQQKHCN